ncbi:MAG: IS3 family transposase [Planctomycetes bacterium]|nr:IS3 family transposase [Planctomycetota bacterium]
MVLTESFAASAVCDALDVSRSGFYAWRSEEESHREEADRELTPVICDVFWHHRRRYGARRIAVALSERGIVCGVARVARLLKNQGLRAIQPQSFTPRTTDSRHSLGYNENLLKGRKAPLRVDEVWVGDITYIPLATRTSGSRFGYLALLMDLFSRRIVGWDFGLTMDEELVLGALRRAIRDRQPESGLIHHTDRGGQYASARYRAVLRRAGISQSMSAAANCYDNAFMESCFGTIKQELELVEYESSADALRELSSYIRYYNAERIHSSLGYVSPAQFETQHPPGK